MSWHRPDQRPIVDFPEGRDWRCTGTVTVHGDDGPPDDPHYTWERPCEGVKPEAEGGQPFGCPECGGPMSRIVVQL